MRDFISAPLFSRVPRQLYTPELGASTDSKQKSLPLRSARLSSLLPIKSFLSPNSRLTAKTPKPLQPPKTF